MRLVVNGDVRELGTIERDFGRLFEKDPEVRRNMNFGWLYTAVLEDVAVSGDAPLPPLPTPTEEPEPEPVPPEARPTLAERLAAQQEWLEGRPDRLEQHLGAVADAVDGRALLPFALRDLWWRPIADAALGARCRDVAAGTGDPVLADQLRWVLAGGGDPYPTYGVAAWDPWPVLTALVLERQQREAAGARWLPDESPVLRRRVLDAPVAWQDWYARWCAWFYDEVMRTAYEGEDPERVPRRTGRPTARRRASPRTSATGTRGWPCWPACSSPGAHSSSGDGPHAPDPPFERGLRGHVLRLPPPQRNITYIIRRFRGGWCGPLPCLEVVARIVSVGGTCRRRSSRASP